MYGAYVDTVVNKESVFINQGAHHCYNRQNCTEQNLFLSFSVNGVSVGEVMDFCRFVFNNFQFNLQRTELSYYTTADVRSFSTSFPNYTG
jgi:hypothetical protein